VRAPRITERSEARDHLNAPLWLTSLQRPESLKSFRRRMSAGSYPEVTQEFWEPTDLVLVSSPPGFCVQGSVVYCKKLPSEDYILASGWTRQ